MSGTNNNDNIIAETTLSTTATTDIATADGSEDDSSLSECLKTLSDKALIVSSSLEDIFGTAKFLTVENNRLNSELIAVENDSWSSAQNYLAAIGKTFDQELYDLKSRAATSDKKISDLQEKNQKGETTMTQLKKDHKKKIKNVRSECDAIRSELKTKNNEAAVLQKQNAELRLEIDQKNQTIDELQAKVALHATKIKGHDAIP